MKTVIIDNLECVLVGNESATQAVVLFHGYGANMHDLAGLHSMLKFERDTCFYFPNGPISLGLSAYMDARAWFNIDEKALELAMSRGEHRDFTCMSSEHFEPILAQLEQFCLGLKKNYKSLIIGGFSQGTMLSSHLLMRLQNQLTAVILFSGVLVDKVKMDRYQSSFKLPIFQSHGENDPILAFDGAKELAHFFKNFNPDHRFCQFKGQHEIPMFALKSLNSFISEFGL
jgi:phospholipase/carboxylesterase